MRFSGNGDLFFCGWNSEIVNKITGTVIADKENSGTSSKNSTEDTENESTNKEDSTADIEFEILEIGNQTMGQKNRSKLPVPKTRLKNNNH